MLITKIWKKILDFFFNDCINCGLEATEHKGLCEKCKEDIELFHGCFNCKQIFCCCEFKSFIPFVYKNCIRNLILRFKYSKQIYLGDIFAKMILDNINIKIDHRAVLIPVPISRSKMFSRTYNQSVILCKSISLLTGAPIAYFTFKKTKNTSQKGQSYDNRIANAINIELDDISKVINKNVFIIDDVIASGSTVKRCSSLLQNICLSVNVIAIAKS